MLECALHRQLQMVRVHATKAEESAHRRGKPVSVRSQPYFVAVKLVSQTNIAATWS